MKIAIIARSTVYHFKSGGMETHLKNLALGLKEAGHNVEIITSSLPYDEKIQIEDEVRVFDYIKYHFLGDTTPGLNPLSTLDKLFVMLGLLKRGVKHEGKISFYKKSYQYFKSLNQSAHFDLVISQSTATQQFPDYDNVRAVAILHGTISTEIRNRMKSNRTFKNWVRFLILDLPNWTYEKNMMSDAFYKNLNQIVVVSEQLKKDFLLEHPHSSNKTVVIYNGIDQNKFLYQKKVYPKEMLNLLYIGRVDREKGIDVLLETIPILVSNNVELQLTIVGDGIHKAEMEHYAKLHGISDIVDFVGPKTNDEVILYYQNADLFVFPSKRVEGHPMTISEANCTGLPVISTSIGGLRELIIDGENGFAIDTPSPIEFAKKITELYQDQTIIAKMSEKSREIGLTKYSRASMIRSYLDLFESL